MAFFDHINDKSMPHNWCEPIEKRCDELSSKIESRGAGESADEICMNTPDRELGKLCEMRFACHWIATECETNPPLLTPQRELGIEKLGEDGSYHDLPAFYEMSGIVINDMLRKPEGPEDSAKILYFAAGHHIAPLEFALQTLGRTEYQKVDLTYTEIEPSLLEDIRADLRTLVEQDLIYNLGRTRGKSTDTHDEFIVEFDHCTAGDDTKSVSLKFVVGKITDGEYPPYFRQEDYDTADIVIAFDAEDVGSALESLREARQRSKGEDTGKVVVMENRGGYSKWANENSDHVIDFTSQEYGCEAMKVRMRRKKTESTPLIFRLSELKCVIKD